MNRISSGPRPSGIEPSIWEQFFEKFLSQFPISWQETLYSWGNVIKNFWDSYATWILLIIVILALLKVMISVVRRQEKSIQKLWNLLLFFLSKRQMMIPLIYTVAKREKMLKDEELQKLLEIKQKCHSMPFKKDPQKRLEVEKEASRVLFSYFSQVEQKKQKNPIMQQVIKDFEFMDQKLVELQKVYNQAAQSWNKKRNIFPISLLAGIFRFKRFQPFGDRS